MPHGGPIGVFDDRYFDLDTQFLAMNNFAVLRVNFRGSSGYGKQLREAGKGEFGGLMLKDIHTAAVKVIQRAEIDGNRVCSIGFSYGGYAATMLSILHPDFYRCAINIAGISDINLYLNAAHVTRDQDRWLKEHIGDSDADYERLKSQSPAYLAQRLSRPILIMHGEKDTVVSIEHAYRLKLMLEKYDKPFEWKTFPDNGHGFIDNASRVALFNRIMQFLATHLHGSL